MHNDKFQHIADALRASFDLDRANDELDRLMRLAEEAIETLDNDRDPDRAPLFRDQPDYAADGAISEWSAPGAISRAYAFGDADTRREIDRMLARQRDEQQRGHGDWFS